MAIRRAGLFEAPSNIVSPQRIDPGVNDDSSVYRALGNVARQAREALQPLYDQHAEAQAAEDFERGDVSLRLALTHQDEVYNNAITQAYLLNAEGDISARAQEIEGEALTLNQSIEDVDAAFAAARGGFMESAPDGLAPHLGQLFDRMHAEARQRIGQRRTSAAIAGLQGSANARLEQLEAELLAYEPGSPEFAERLAQYDQVGEMVTGNPLAGITDDEWAWRRDNFLSVAQANSIANHAERTYEEGGANAESAQAADAELAEAMANPALHLTDAQRDRYLAEGRRRINARETQRRRDEAEARRDLLTYRGLSADEARDMMPGANARTQSLVVIPQSDLEVLRSRVEASGNAGLARQYNDLVIANEVNAQLQGQSLIQVEAAAQRYRELAGAGGENAGDYAVALQQAERYIANLRGGDTITSMQMHYGEQPAPLIRPPAVRHGHSVGEPSLDFGQRIRQVEAVQTDLGAAQATYFTPAERQHLQATLRAGGEEALMVVQQLVSDAMSQEGGDAFARTQTMLSEIAGDDAPSVAAAGALLVRGGIRSTPAARALMEGVRLRNTEGYHRARPQGLANSTEDSEIQEVIPPSVIRQLDPQALAQIRLSADLIHDGMAAADPSRGEDAQAFSRSYQNAVRLALGEVTRNGQRWGGVAAMGGGNDVLIPNWIRTDQFGTLYRSLQQRDFIDAGGGVAPNERTIASWRNARLVPIPGRLGQYMLADDRGFNFTATVNGRTVPYVFDVNNLRDNLAGRRPDAVVN